MITFIETNTINDFSDLQMFCWSGAQSRLDEIEELGLEDEFMEYLEEMFSDDTDYTLTDINDFIWFECDEWIEEHKEENEDDDD